MMFPFGTKILRNALLTQAIHVLSAMTNEIVRQYTLIAVVMRFDWLK